MWAVPDQRLSVQKSSGTSNGVRSTFPQVHDFSLNENGMEKTAVSKRGSLSRCECIISVLLEGNVVLICADDV